LTVVTFFLAEMGDKAQIVALALAAAIYAVLGVAPLLEYSHLSV
jgi:putative Ca2+/H+ antiporter (TMEM165/GDT1 family)